MIPQKLRKKYGIMAGTKIGFIDKNGEIILRPFTKEYFAGFAGWLKGDVLGELMEEKRKEREL